MCVIVGRFLSFAFVFCVPVVPVLGGSPPVQQASTYPSAAPQNFSLQSSCRLCERSACTYGRANCIALSLTERHTRPQPLGHTRTHARTQLDDTKNKKNHIATRKRKSQAQKRRTLQFDRRVRFPQSAATTFYRHTDTQAHKYIDTHTSARTHLRMTLRV